MHFIRCQEASDGFSDAPEEWVTIPSSEGERSGPAAGVTGTGYNCESLPTNRLTYPKAVKSELSMANLRPGWHNCTPRPEARMELCLSVTF